MKGEDGKPALKLYDTEAGICFMEPYLNSSNETEYKVGLSIKGDAFVWHEAIGGVTDHTFISWNVSDGIRFKGARGEFEEIYNPYQISDGKHNINITPSSINFDLTEGSAEASVGIINLYTNNLGNLKIDGGVLDANFNKTQIHKDLKLGEENAYVEYKYIEDTSKNFIGYDIYVQTGG